MALTMQQVRAQFPQYHDLSDEQLAQGLHQKFYSDMPFDQFSKTIGYSPTPAAPSLSEKIANATNGYIDPAATGHALAGEAELLGGGIANIPHGVLSAGGDLLQRLGITAKNPAEHALEVPTGQTAKEFVTGVGQTPAAQAVGDAAHRADTAIGNFSPVLQDVLHEGAGVAGDVLNLVPGVAGAKAVVSGVGRTLAESAAAGATDAARAGFRNGETLAGRTGTSLAGDSAKPTLVNHNAAVGNTIASSEAGVPHGTDLSYEALAEARTAPNAVYDRVAAELPDGELNTNAQNGIRTAGQPEGGRVSQGSPQAQAQIETLRQQLLTGGPRTGRQWVNELRGLRQEGFTNAASDDISNQQLGRAQLDMARAIEGHIGDTLPPNGTVSLQQFQDARKALAKNFTVQSALRGNDVDLNALARVQRADPQLLDGGLKTAADFANENREVVGLPTKLKAPGLVQDLRDVSLTKPSTIVQAPGLGVLGRRLLTGGSTDSTLERTRRLFGNRGDFAPLEPQAPQPPLGMAIAGEGAGGPAPAAPGRPGDIPLADLLSHGVEQPAPGGLSLAPGGAPAAPGGIPFQVDPGHAAGGLELAPEAAAGAGEPRLGDLAAVMSQGVPEGIMSRTTRPRGRGTIPTIDYPEGTTHEALANNASGESAASQEAINRGTRDLAVVDPDGNGTDLLRDVTQVDRTAPKGHLIVDKSTGNIVDRGGLPKNQAEGLRNRWASRVKLGDNFTSGG